MQTPTPHYNRRLDAIRRQLIGWGMELGNAVRPTKPPVVILQMGKVGSTSLAHAIRQIDHFSVFQIHFLNRDSIEDNIRSSNKASMYAPRHLIKSQFVGENIIKNGKTLKLITIVREPIARNVSAFFQNIHIYAPEYISSGEHAIDVNGLMARFFHSDVHTFPFTYFDREIKQPLGLDVYAHNFPLDQGYHTIHTPRFELLVMQFELNEAAKMRAVCDFLGVQSISIPSLNRSEQKGYAGLYKEMIKNISFPKEYIDQMYDSKYMRHFYKPQQIEHFRAFWNCK